MDFITLLLLAIGVSMDAFAVSICNGLYSQGRGLARGGVISGLWFGGFQALMPIVGYFVGSAFHSSITAIDHWVAFVLLALIGGNMVRESWGEMRHQEPSADATLGECECGCRVEPQGAKGPTAPYATRRMFPLAIATSIDALAVGISLAMLSVNIWSSALFIGLTTFVFAFVGVWIGGRWGARHKSKAELTGGIILILIGLRILIEHTCL